MQYLIMLRHGSGAGPQEGTPEFDAEMKRWGELVDELRDAGVLVAVSGLKGDAVTTLRAPGGDVTVTDGPYAETKEVLFSFFVLEAPDLDAVAAWAAKMPSSAYGSTEIHPMIDSLPGFEQG
jgi:hypothetical protein